MYLTIIQMSKSLRQLKNTFIIQIDSKSIIKLMIESKFNVLDQNINHSKRQLIRLINTKINVNSFDDLYSKIFVNAIKNKLTLLNLIPTPGYNLLEIVKYLRIISVKSFHY